MSQQTEQLVPPAVEQSSGEVVTKQSSWFQGSVPYVVAIIVGAWFIAMGIVMAGYLVAEKMVPPSGGVATQNQPTTSKPAPLSLPSDIPFLGNKDAQVTVVEFADYQCPFCGQFQKEIYPQLKKEYIDTGKIKYVYQNFPFLGQESQDAAEAAQCAGVQGKFWEYHDALFAHQNGENEGAFSLEKLATLGTTVGVNANDLLSCVKARTFAATIDKEMQGGVAAGVDSTPSIFINGYLLTGVRDYAEYKKFIDQGLAR
jgi:protein-disulfide isomerase